MTGHPSLFRTPPATEAQKSPLKWGARCLALGIARLSVPALGLWGSGLPAPNGGRRRDRSGARQPSPGRPPAFQPGSARARGGSWGGALEFAGLNRRDLPAGLGLAHGFLRGVGGEPHGLGLAGGESHVGEADRLGEMGQALCLSLANFGGEQFAGFLAEFHFISCWSWGSSPDNSSIGPLARNARGKARNAFRNSQVVQMGHIGFTNVMEGTA